MEALIIQTAFLGDAIISLALAEELRRLSPDSQISYLVRPEIAPIIRLSPSVTHVFTFDKYKTESGLSDITKKATQLNEQEFDTIFTLHSSKRTMMLLSRLKAKRKIGYGNYNVLTDRITEINEPHTAKAVRLLQVFFPEVSFDALPKLNSSEAMLPDEVRSLARPIIAIAPDSVWWTKQWGIDKFRLLITQLLDKKYSVILVGSDKKQDITKTYNLFDSNLLNLIAKTSLEALTAVISYADLLISNDSAPVHIASATATPSVVIYGPTIPEFGFAPPADLGAIVQNEILWCRPCTSHGSNECPIYTHECMTSISVEDVLNTVVKKLTS